MIMMFAYDDGDDEMCYSYPRLMLTIFIAQVHISITSWIESGSLGNRQNF